ncbi:FAD-dependent oxidoreductase [Nocardioides sp. YJ-D4]
MSGQRTVAVVGAGPAGFFAAQALLAHPDLEIHVDMYDRLPTPTGLVRAGVAPDHPKIKLVSAKFEKTAAHPRFRFIGNAELGAHYTREDLVSRYDAVLYSVGAQGDRRLGVIGEALHGVVSARDFVGWYNGHPDHAQLEADLDVERAVVIGNGNVALDVARILMTPVERLRATDIAPHALDRLSEKSIREVVILGRRGAADAAFTPPEIEELAEMTGARVVIDPADLDIGDRETLPVLTQRALAAMDKYAESDTQPGPEERRITFQFRSSPVAFSGHGRVESMMLGRNVVEADEGGRRRAVDSGEREISEVGLVVRAVGYRGVPVAGLPFDEETGTIANDDGRVRGGLHEYVAGWIKRGPSGIIGTNKKCAVDTVRLVLEDLAAEDSVSEGPVDLGWLEARQPAAVSWHGWQMIDEHERAEGAASGRARVKVCDRQELVALGTSMPAPV